MKFVLRTIAIAVIVVAAVFNAQPILELTRQMFALITNVPFAWLFNAIGLGAVLTFLGHLLIDIVGIGLWALLQTLEMLPSILKGDLAVLQILIRSFSRFKEEVINGNDSEVVIGLKRAHNKVPKKWMQTAETLRAVGYLAEFTLSFMRFPFYQGGIPAFVAALPFHVSGSAFLYGNIAWALVTIFAFEIIVWFVSWMIRGQASFGFGSSKTKKHNNDFQDVPEGY